jgi:hypothetical protein
MRWRGLDRLAVPGGDRLDRRRGVEYHGSVDDGSG